MHGKMVHNSCSTGKTWVFEDLGRISDWQEALGTVFRENVGTQIYPYNQCTIIDFIFARELRGFENFKIEFERIHLYPY